MDELDILRFKSLIVDAYKCSLDSNLIGVVFTTCGDSCFSDFAVLDAMEEFVESVDVTKLYLKSNVTDAEIVVLPSELEDYKVSHSQTTIYVKLKNKMEIAIMY